MGNHVFVSYARADQAFVLALATRLKERGVPVWLDAWNIPAGADWDEAIDTGITACASFVIVLSPAAVESNAVKGELAMALDLKRPVVPVLHRPCTIPRRLRLIQHVDYTGHQPEDDPPLAALVSVVRRDPPAPVPSAIGSPWLTADLMNALGTNRLTLKTRDALAMGSAAPHALPGRRTSSAVSPLSPSSRREPATAPPESSGGLVAKVVGYAKFGGTARLDTAAAVRLGDVLHVRGPLTDFVQVAAYLEQVGQPVKAVAAGARATVRVIAPVSEGDRVYKLDLDRYIREREKALGIGTDGKDELVGLVERFDAADRVAAVLTNSGERIRQGTTLRVRGTATDETQHVWSLRRERQPAAPRDGPAVLAVGVSGRVRAGDLVYIVA